MSRAPDSEMWFSVGLYELDEAKIPSVLAQLFRMIPEKQRYASVVDSDKSVSIGFDEISEYLRRRIESSHGAAVTVTDGKGAAPHSLHAAYSRGRKGASAFVVTKLITAMQLETTELDSILHLARCEYGIGIIRPWEARAYATLQGFPIGGGSSDDSRLGRALWYELLHLDSTNKKLRRRYAEGYFVDIFPYNVITERHLARIVNGSDTASILRSQKIDVRAVGTNFVFNADPQQCVKLRSLLASAILLGNPQAGYPEKFVPLSSK